MYPIVNIIYSAPAMNTGFKKQAIPNLNPDAIHDGHGGTGLAALSLPQGLSLPVVAYIIKLFLPFPFI